MNGYEDELEHWEALRECRGVTVIYRRGTSGIEFTAVPSGGSNDQYSFANAPVMQDESKSFLVKISDMRNFYPPQKNDVIEVKEWKTNRSYDVKPLSNGACFTDSGNHNVMIRIHVIRS
ncbi:MAG: hypothetical protein LBQ54_02235 [Planctomycetaceae bacterium]|jgi:hypothetical protein|nr:hypothetical protein [Planctomycetaceae bacterium]